MNKATPLSRSNKGKSAARWASGRTLVKEVLPTLPLPSHAAVIWACWFAAEITDNGRTIFNLTKDQIAIQCGLRADRIKTILRDLEDGGVIKTRKDGCNVGGRSLGSERMITFEPYRKPGKGVRP